MIQLSEAAAIVYQRMYWRIGHPSDGMLEAIAAALSARLEIFGVREPGAQIATIGKKDCRTGRFRWGARRFE